MAANFQGKKGRQAKYPCGVCGKQVRTNAVQCGTCIAWFHCHCEELSPDHLSLLGDMTLDYTCRGCCQASFSGTFDIGLSLRRLSKYSSNFKALTAAAEREGILLRESPVLYGLPNKVTMGPSLRPDLPSIHLLKSSSTGGVDDRTPVAVGTDGNCLFNAISVAIEGDESLSKELRVRTCIELITYADTYIDMHRNSGLDLVSPTYESACSSCATDGAYSSAWTMQAAASVIGTPIVSVYPPMNGIMDRCVKILNVTFQPRVLRKRAPIFLMWTSTGHSSGKTWIPNHFVPLIRNVNNKTFAQVLASSTPSLRKPAHYSPVEEGPLIQDSQSSPRKDQVEIHDLTSSSTPLSKVHSISPQPLQREDQSDLENYDLSTSAVSSPCGPSPAHKVLTSPPLSKDSCELPVYDLTCSVTPPNRSLSPIDLSSPSPPTKNPHDVLPQVQVPSEDEFEDSMSTPFGNKRKRAHKSSTDLRHTTSTSDLEGSDCFSADDSFVGQVVRHDDGWKNLKGHFLTPDDLYNLICNCTDVPKYTEIPPGNKDNKYFLINNYANVINRKHGKRSDFTDDCGVWDYKLTSTKRTDFLNVNNRFVCIKKKQGKYYKVVSGRNIEISPQPLDNDVVIMKRYYSTLKRDHSFKKRICWFEQLPHHQDSAKLNIAVVEYLGKFPKKGSAHGNRKKGESEYIRSSKKCRDELRKTVKENQPRKVYKNMLVDSVGAPNIAPRDVKQVENMKYRVNCSYRPGEHRRNTADDVQSVINMIHDNPYIQEIIQSKSKPPSIILYTEEQLKDITNICSDNSTRSILGIDRTFNLGSCFVTSFVYQHRNLIRKTSQTSPIMLGPVYLHWDGTYNTYQRFFSHVQGMLKLRVAETHLGFSNVIIGSDEEKALVKAAEQCFTGATFVLCTRHLEENVGRFLIQKVGMTDKVKGEVINEIFGKDGLISADNMVDFECEVVHLGQLYEKKLPGFVNYFKNKLVPSLRNYVIGPCMRNKFIPLNWKNNCCESMNHIMKLSSNWKPSKLPDLINNLHDIVKLQYLDMERAMIGQGNYEIAPWVPSRFKIHPQVWATKSNIEQKKLFYKFLSWQKDRSIFVTSSDGELKIPRTPLTAKKPGQRKRIRKAKTLTFNH